jgi:hypothetical protein
MAPISRKEILVIGGTGAQGIPVVKGEDLPSPQFHPHTDLPRQPSPPPPTTPPAS